MSGEEAKPLGTPAGSYMPQTSLRPIYAPPQHLSSTMFAPDTEYKVVQREQVANPAPLGLFAFGLTTALLQGANTAITEPEATEFWVFGYGLAFGGLAQLLAGMWEFKRQNTFGATAFSSYGAFWIGFALHGTLAASGVYSASSANAGQITLALWGMFTFVMMIATLDLNFALFSLFFTLAVLFFLLTAGLTTPSPWTKIAGWWGFVVAAIAWYIAAADVINEQFKRTVLPVGRWSVGSSLFKGVRAVLPKIPLLGGICIAGMDREDNLAGYVKKTDVEQAETPHDYRAGRLHTNQSLYMGAWEGPAVQFEQQQATLASAIGPY